MTWPVMARDLQQYLGTVLAANYRIERELGVGATARVYLAHDLKHDRLVALKVLRPEIAVAMGAERFLREIQTAARLSHPGILPLYDSGETEGLLYFTMPFIEGESLRDRLEREERLPVDEAVRITRDVAEALGFAHECGVIHRDVKPENILLAGHSPDGRRHTGGVRPLVADFGIALALEDSESRLTHTGMVVGTPRYMSPEQSIGIAALDHRTDVYSLACVLYEMLTGRAPFEGPTLQAIVTQRRYEDPPAIQSLRPDVPRAVSNALAEALAKDPADRFASMEQFSAALVDPTRRRRMTRRAARRLRVWAGVGVALSALAVVGAVAVRTQTSPLKRRDWVVVSDFDGPPSDPALGRVVRELVTTELNQSRFVSTMPRSALAGALRASGRPETTRVNVDLARELAERSSVRAVVTGNVETAGDGYRLVVRVVDHDAGKEIATASAVASADSVVPVVQRLGHALREQLGERRSELERNQVLLDIATPSLPAYRRYVDALARKESGDVAGSNRLLRDAVALDTGFAAAWALMGLNYIEARNLDSARLTLSEALRRPQRLSTAQSYRLKADAAYAIDRDLTSAVKWYTQYLSLVPNSVGGRSNRGLYMYMLGRYEDALADFDSAAANNPFGRDQDPPMVINAADMLMALGRPDRAAERARARSPASTPTTHRSCSPR
ncbi:protein kinase [Gemmatirosa kalamazoonensis]|uniref:non-specific serine/threonine protein kinase n=1 Tax=Gemmatirosa kalamazoonensis TaxID=861299 RepID=W0RH02_9BACT|nr:serine/threonine-protein kinase [Gemmatirosa kalamazoonensis]AHG90389.1 protein kinase [Gemmatirosa kalamazoonensis]